MVAKVNNYLLVWLLRIWWGRLWPKNGWGTPPPRGPSKLKNTSIDYKWLQKLIIICWYGYCGCGEVSCDPKVGGGPPGGPQFWKNTFLGYKWLQKLIIICWFGSDWIRVMRWVMAKKKMEAGAPGVFEVENCVLIWDLSISYPSVDRPRSGSISRG